MKAEFAGPMLRCPVCRRDRTLALTDGESDQREVREGGLRCSSCAAEFPVHRGVGHLLHDPPEHVLREAAGLERFAEQMRADGWDRERIKALPNVEDGYWFVQRRSMEQVLDEVDFAPGQWIVDVGSNTCWAANRFAQLGLNAIALDIATTELQGLYTSDYFLDGGVYFERVLGSMYDLPLASESLDYVFCCEVLHHNDDRTLRRTFAEAYRVLRPGGKLLVVNETLKTLSDPGGVHIDHVAQFEGYEHAFWAARYRWEAARAGFRSRLLLPVYHAFFTGRPESRLLRFLRRTRLGRRIYTAWLTHVKGEVSLSFVAIKPSRERRITGSRPRTARSG